MSKISLKKYGSGKNKIVCFPGWIHPMEKEPVFIKKLAKHFTVYTLQLPGYMDQPESRKLLSFEKLSREIHDLLEEEEVGLGGSRFEKSKPTKSRESNTTFLGFSMGCRLIMSYLQQFEHRGQLVFIGLPTGDYNLPFWAKIILSSDFLIHFFRKNNALKSRVVDLATASISSDKTAKFKPKHVSLTGAFDTLVALLKSGFHWQEFRDRACFIYGQRDKYLAQIKRTSPKTLHVLEGLPHNCVTEHEEEIVKIIALTVSV